MAKLEWGTKHTCQSCGAKYYDLNRSPVTCPKCGTVFNPEALLRSRRNRPAAAAKEAVAVVKSKAPLQEADAELDEGEEDLKVAALAGADDVEDLADDEDDDDVIEDTSDLGDDDVVVEVVVGDDDKDDT